MSDYLDKYTKIDDLLRQNITQQNKLIEEQKRTNMLLQAIAEKEAIINIPSTANITLRTTAKGEIYTQLSPFYHHAKTNTWYMKENKLGWGSGTANVTANTYIGGTTEPTKFSWRSVMNTDDPVIFIELFYYPQTNCETAGPHAYLSNDPQNPIVGTYHTDYSAYGNRYPLEVTDGQLYHEIFNPPVFMGKNEDLMMMNMNLGGSTASYGSWVNYITLEKMTKDQIIQYGLDKVF